MSFNYICIYIILYYTILYSIILYYIYYAILYSTILYYTILYSIVLYYILCYVMLWYIVLYEKSYHMYIYICMHLYLHIIYIYATRPGVFTDTMEMQSQNLSHVIDSLKSGNHPGLATPLAPACDQICLPLLPTSYTLFTSFIDNYIDAYEYI